MSKSEKELDFKPFGLALKKARTDLKLSRNKVSDLTGLAPRYLANIENAGQRPSLQTLYKLIMLYEMSVDPLFFPDKSTSKSTERRQVDTALDKLTDSELSIVLNTAEIILKARDKED